VPHQIQLYEHIFRTRLRSTSLRLTQTYAIPECLAGEAKVDVLRNYVPSHVLALLELLLAVRLIHWSGCLCIKRNWSRAVEPPHFEAEDSRAVFLWLWCWECA